MTILSDLSSSLTEAADQYYSERYEVTTMPDSVYYIVDHMLGDSFTIRVTNNQARTLHATISASANGFAPAYLDRIKEVAETELMIRLNNKASFWKEQGEILATLV